MPSSAQCGRPAGIGEQALEVSDRGPSARPWRCGFPKSIGTSTLFSVVSGLERHAPDQAELRRTGSFSRVGGLSLRGLARHGRISLPLPSRRRRPNPMASASRPCRKLEPARRWRKIGRAAPECRITLNRLSPAPIALESALERPAVDRASSASDLPPACPRPRRRSWATPKRPSWMKVHSHMPDEAAFVRRRARRVFAFEMKTGGSGTRLAPRSARCIKRSPVGPGEPVPPPPLPGSRGRPPRQGDASTRSRPRGREGRKPPHDTPRSPQAAGEQLFPASGRSPHARRDRSPTNRV